MHMSRMRTGAFDVSFGNIKIKQITTNVHSTNKRPMAREESASTHVKRNDEHETPEECIRGGSAAIEAGPQHIALPPLTANCIVTVGMRVCLPALCCILAVFSVSTSLPYMGTIVNVVSLEMVPVVVLLLDTSIPFVTYCTAILAMGACVSLFVLSDPMRQTFVSYPMYVSLVLILVLLAVAPPRLKNTDLLLVAITCLAVLSALLLRHVLVQQPRVVQTTEFTLLVLCACTYAFLLHRHGTLMMPASS